MRTYDTYKDSGISWLGQIPSHWELKPGFSLYHVNNEKFDMLSEPTVLSLSYGNIIVKKNKDEGLVPENYSGYQVIKPDYIIIRCTDLQNDKVSLRTGIAKNHGIITGAYLGLIANDGFNAQYLHYFLHDWDITKEIYRHGSGLRQVLSWNDMKRLPILVPPLAEQEAIVAYLDSATAEIDKAIASQRLMMELLQERKQIIINQAVTQGLNPDAPMKPTNIDWLPKIPAHWDLRRLKYLLKSPLQYGANESPESTDTNLPRYIRITDIKENGKLNDDSFVSLSWEKAKDYLLQKGDILFARSGATVGKTYLFEEQYSSCFAGYLIKARSNDGLLPEFLYLFTKSGVYDKWKESIFIKSTIQNIGADKYSNLPVPFPPYDEQKAIVEYIESTISPVNSAISRCEHIIALLTERKQILINDVVTGKIKII